jgi:hypothetical protein
MGLIARQIGRQIFFKQRWVHESELYYDFNSISKIKPLGIQHFNMLMVYCESAEAHACKRTTAPCPTRRDQNRVAKRGQ